MALGSGSNVQITYIKETTHGQTPGSPTMKVLRATSRNINPAKNTLESAEVRSHRQVQDFRHGFESVGGNLGFELAMEDYDDMIAGVLADAFAAGASSGTVTMDVDDTAKTFTRSTGSFVTDGFEAGQYATFSGFSNSGNNGTFFITDVTATVLTVLDPNDALTTETGGGDEAVSVDGQVCKVGSTLDTFTIERGLLDLGKYQVFRGVAINQLSLSIQPDSIVTATLDMLGMDSDDFVGTSLDGTPTQPQNNSPFDAFTGEGIEGGAVYSILTGINFSINNQRSVESRLFSSTSPDVFEGTAMITGDMTAYFEDETLFSKFKAETETSLAIKLDAPDGSNFHAIYFPRIVYNAANMDPPQNGPIIVNFTFQAKYDTDLATSVMWQISNA